MENYTQLANALKTYDEDWEISGPQSPLRVEKIEKMFNLRLPDSYRQFLIEVGAIEFPNHTYTGLDEDYLHPEYGFMSMNKSIKTEYGLPDGLFVLEYDHDADELACLDLNKMSDGECPVVWYHIYKQEISGMCAKSFDEFFRQIVSDWKEIST